MDPKLEAALSRAVVTTLGRAPSRMQSLIGGRHRNRSGADLEPEVAAALRLLNSLPDSDISQLSVEDARARIETDAALFGGEPLPMAEVREVSVPSFTGEIPARLYRADSRDSDRLLVYFHGGGWVVGSLDSADAACRFIAAHSGVSVLSVGYRLAPENPFPGPLNDARTAFMFAASRAKEWGHDLRRIAVGGDSAGGNLATGLCHMLRGAAVQPAFQLLFFPVTDLSSKSESYWEFSDGFFLTHQLMDWFADHYLGDTDRSNPLVSPLLAEDLSGLPPAYVAVAGFDPLRDEGEAYARRLAEAGVPVALRRHDGLIHAFVNTTGVGRCGREAMIEACGALRVGLGAGLSPRG